MNPNYIPNRDPDTAAWLTNFAALITVLPATYGLVVGQAVAATSAASAFAAALALATNPATRTSVTVAGKDAARASALNVIRVIAVAVSANPLVTNAAKEAVGVTIRQLTPSPIPAPVVAPVIEFLEGTPLRQRLQIRIPGSTSKAKPFGAIGIELARSVGTVAATDPEQLAIVGTFGKTPLFQDFAAADQGKRVTYASRYVTRSGPGGVAQKGPWSALVTFVVS